MTNNHQALLRVSQVGLYVLEGAKDLDAIPSVSGCRLYNPNWACHKEEHYSPKLMQAKRSDGREFCALCCFC